MEEKMNSDIDNDREWQSRGDARTLADAEVIKNDPERMESARQAAKKILKERQEEIKGFVKIASKSSSNRQVKTSQNSKSSKTTFNALIPKF